MHSATIMSFFVINDIIRFMRMHARIYSPISHIHKESVKSVHSSRSTRASQSPNKVEKQPKSTPDIYTPPHPLRAWSGYDISTGHSSLLSGLYSKKFCEDFKMSQTTSINACYVTAFLRCRCQRNLSIYPNSLQRYDFFLIYARKIEYFFGVWH